MIRHPHIELLGYKIFSGEKEFFSNEFRGVINTINPHSYIVARKDNRFRFALKSSDILIADGVGITMAARVLAGRRIERIPGSDLHEVLLTHLGNKIGSCFYLGSSEETLEKIKERISIEHPGIRTGTLSPPFKEAFSMEDNESIINLINDFDPEILFVGMTAPKQEKWIHDNKHLINAKVICAIGAVFDFYAGTKKRPSKFWISIGLEWLPRFIREPGRLWQRNLISTPLFIWFVLCEKVKSLISSPNPKDVDLSDIL